MGSPKKNLQPWDQPAWTIRQPEWKEGESRWVLPLPLPVARARTRPPKAMVVVLSLAGLHTFRRQMLARVDKLIAKAESHERRKRGSSVRSKT
jgi:hypothetical protein